MADEQARRLEDSLGSQNSGAAGSWWTALQEIYRVAGEPGEWKAFGHRIYTSGSPYLLLAANFLYQNFSSFVAKCLWTIAGLIIATYVFRGLTERVTIIEPMAVPKTLIDRGYSPEVSAQRFRDAMTKYANSINTRMQRSEVALHRELPNITVPTIGMSLDAVMSSIRTLIGS